MPTNGSGGDSVSREEWVGTKVGCIMPDGHGRHSCMRNLFFVLWKRQMLRRMIFSQCERLISTLRNAEITSLKNKEKMFLLYKT